MSLLQKANPKIDVFVDRIRWELSACVNCGSIFKRSSFLCTSCEIAFEVHHKKSISEARYRMFKHHFLYAWNPNESDGLSNLALSFKVTINPSFYEHYANKLFLSRIAKNDFGLDEPILIPAPARVNFRLDHACRLALAIKKTTGFELYSPLERESSQSQRGKSREQREGFRLRNPEKFTPKNPVIFVDDVLTTGATARAAYEALGHPQNFEIWTVFYRRLLAPMPRE